MLHCCHLKIPNNFIFELVFCQWSTMEHEEQRDMHTWGFYITAQRPLACTICKDRCIELPRPHGARESNRTQRYSTAELVVPWEQLLTPQKGDHTFHSNQLDLKEVNSVVSNKNNQEILSYPFRLATSMYSSHAENDDTERVLLPPLPCSQSKRQNVSYQVRLFRGLEKAGLSS